MSRTLVIEMSVTWLCCRCYSASSYSIGAVSEILSEVLRTGLKYYPTNVPWLRLMGDINYGLLLLISYLRCFNWNGFDSKWQLQNFTFVLFKIVDNLLRLLQHSDTLRRSRVQTHDQVLPSVGLFYAGGGVVSVSRGAGLLSGFPDFRLDHCCYNGNN